MAAGLLVLVSSLPARAQCPPGPGSCVITLSQTVSGTIDASGRDLVVSAGAILTVNGPALAILARDVTLEAGATIVAPGTGATGANVTIEASGTIWLKTGAVINTYGDVVGGDIRLIAEADVEIDGQLDTHSGKLGTFAGIITIISTGGDVLLAGAAPVNGTAGDQGSGSTLTVVTGVGDIRIDGTVDLSAGANGGSVDMDAANVLTLTAVTGKLDVSVTMAGSDAGDITLHAVNGVTLAGAIAGRSKGNSTNGAGSGASVEIHSEGDITIAGLVDVTGPRPDGWGGSLTVDGAAVTLTGTLAALGDGADGCGGDALFRATGPLTLGPMDLSGGSCGGGTLDARSDGTLSVPAEISADGSSGGAGGRLTLRGQAVDVTGKVHANGLAGAGGGGAITLHGCALTVSAQVATQGALGKNSLLANGSMVVGAAVIAGGKTCAAGANRRRSCQTESDCPPPSPPSTIPPTGLCTETGINQVEYANPGSPPALNATPTPPPVPPGGLLNANLNPCVGPELPSTTTTTSTTSSTSTSITATTLPTTTSSTSTSTTTSSSSSSPTSAPPSTSTSSSTTSTLPECSAGVPLACDDGDPCTDDQCVEGVCAHPATEGVPAVTCRLDMIDADLQAASADDLGGTRVQARLVRRVSAVRRTVDRGGEPGTPRARQQFKRAGRKLRALSQWVDRALLRHKIAPDIGERLLRNASLAESKILPLQRR